MSITVHYFVMKEKKRKGEIGIANEPLSTVNPLISPPGGIFISSPFEGGLHRDRGGLLNSAKTRVSIFQKEPKYKVEKLKYKMLEVMQPTIKNNSELPDSLRTKFYSPVID